MSTKIHFSNQLRSLTDAINGSECGGKATGLAQLARLELPVPQAVVIPATVFEEFVETNGIAAFTSRALASVDDDPQGWSQAAAAIHEFVADCPLPHSLSESLANEDLLSLAGPARRFAVRSSGVGEDSKEAAFAGVLDTLTDVGPADLADAIRTCWASYWSPRAWAYQRARQVPLQGLAVVIQRQVQSAASGVLFTRSPLVSEADNQMILECCAGAGEQLVGGHVQPLRAAMDRETGTFHVLRELDEHRILRELIDETVVSRLYDYGRTLEAHFGAAQDIEWTIGTDGELCLLQSRPISTLDTSQQEQTPPRTIIWSNANINENYPHPVTPLLYSIARRAYENYFRGLGQRLGVSSRRLQRVAPELKELVGVHKGRLYYNLSNIHKVLRHAPFGDWLTKAFNLFVGAGETENEKRPSNPLYEGLAATRIIVSAIRQFRGVERGVCRFEQRVEDYASRYAVEKIATLPRDELTKGVEDFCRIRFDEWTDAAMADAASMVSYGLWKQVVRAEFSDEQLSALHNSLLKGLREVVSGESVEDLWQLSRCVRDSSELSTLFEATDSKQIWRTLAEDSRFGTFYEACQAYLARWGFRCTGELMFTVSSLEDEPAELVTLISQYTRIEGPSPQQRRDELDGERTDETAQFLAQLRRRRAIRWIPGPSKALFATRLLHWTQESVKLRERARYQQARLYRRFRGVIREWGRRCVAEGYLEQLEDVYQLSLDEITALLRGTEMYPDEVAATAARRRAAFEAFQRSEALPGHFDLAVGKYATHCHTDTTTREESHDRRNGQGVCGGRVIGRAVVLQDASEMAQMKQDDILVVQQTDPGWAPILFLAKGLVMERGGMLSHGAILAREYGIPSVVEISDATQWIRTGMKLLVDGDQGRVEVLDE